MIWVRLWVLNSEKKLEHSGPQNVHEWTKEIQILQPKTFSSFSNPQMTNILRFSNFEPVSSQYISKFDLQVS